MSAEQEIEKGARSVMTSLKRGFWRNVVIIALAVVLYQVVELFPLVFGPVWAPMVRNIGLTMAFITCVDVLMRITQPYLDNEQLGNKAENEPISAAIVFAARMFLTAVMLLTFVMSAKAGGLSDLPPRQLGSNPNIRAAFYEDQAPLYTRTVRSRALLQAQYRESSIEITAAVEERALALYLQAQNAREDRALNPFNEVVYPIDRVRMLRGVRLEVPDVMPENAKKNAPLLQDAMGAYWPSMKLLSLNGAQIEQETCTRLTSPTCWTSKARLHVVSKNGTEDGGGFGQLTRVVRPSGQTRFDNLDAMHLKYPKELAHYSWANWDDPQLSMRAYVLFMRDTCKAVPKTAASDLDMFQMCLSAYNGGVGGLNNDILSCRATKGCNPSKWADNVERTSAKAKTAVPGYGQSAFDINRGYVNNVTRVRRVRYLTLDKLVV